MFLFCFMLSICLFSLPTYTVEAEQSETTNHGEHTDWNVLTCDGGELESGNFCLIKIFKKHRRTLLFTDVFIKKNYKMFYEINLPVSGS